MQALEVDVRTEGVGSVPTALLEEMMPSGEKNRVLSLSKKKFGVFEFGCSWIKCHIGQMGGVTVACKTYYLVLVTIVSSVKLTFIF